MSDYDNTVAELTEKLTGLCGIVTQVTDDPTLVKPSPGKASIWIEPPDFTWEGWHPYPPEITIKLMVTAGPPRPPPPPPFYFQHQVGLRHVAWSRWVGDVYK